MLHDAETDKPQDIRDRAILLLLAIYGLRSGEVAVLRLDQIDWAGRTSSLTGTDPLVLMESDPASAHEFATDRRNQPTLS
jgi:integrase